MIRQAVLLSTYELGRQPFGLASAAAWLRRAGIGVTCMDLAVESLDEELLSRADLIAFSVPMHTATRIAITHLDRVRRINPWAHLCFFGLYAPVNEQYLRELGAQTILGGEFEEGLLALARRLDGDALATGDPTATGASAAQSEPVVSLARQQFLVPDRRSLPLLDRYAQVDLGNGERRVVGYTEATRGCKHLCRHCPIVPVYGGRFRVVQRDVVLEDIRRQVAAGARHITFGDPDFFNGPTHAITLVRALHEEFPNLSYDVTIKIEHLCKHIALLPALRDTGCLFITSAVEAVDEPSLAAFEKNHTKQDFIDMVREFHRIGLQLTPTFVTFSPWTTLSSYAELLRLIAELDLIGSVSPIQYAIRLLIPAKSRLLELPEVHQFIGPFEEQALIYPWTHPDPCVDTLFEVVRDRVQLATESDEDRVSVFRAVWGLAHAALTEASGETEPPPEPAMTERVVATPHLTEPWYCCAEPTEAQITGVSRSPV